MKSATATRVGTFFFQNRSLALHKNAASRVLFFSHVSSLFLSSPYKTCCFFPIFRYFFCVCVRIIVEESPSRQNQLLVYSSEEHIIKKERKKKKPEKEKKLT